MLWESQNWAWDLAKYICKCQLFEISKTASVGTQYNKAPSVGTQDLIIYVISAVLLQVVARGILRMEGEKKGGHYFNHKDLVHSHMCRVGMLCALMHLAIKGSQNPITTLLVDPHNSGFMMWTRFGHPLVTNNPCLGRWSQFYLQIAWHDWVKPLTKMSTPHASTGLTSIQHVYWKWNCCIDYEFPILAELHATRWHWPLYLHTGSEFYLHFDIMK